MIKVTCEVKIYEKDGEDCGAATNWAISVNSHSISDKKIEINVGKYRVVVVAADMIAAIENATNTKRF